MKKLLLSIVAVCSGYLVLAQNPVVRATNVRMVVSAGTQVNVAGGLTFDGTTQLLNNGAINITPSSGLTEHWVDNTTGVMDATGTGLVHFNSNVSQNISGNTRFYDLRINNDVDVIILNNIEVANGLQLDKGLVTTNANTLLVSNPSVTAITSAVSYVGTWVNGRLARVTNVAGTDYLYPIGKYISSTESYYAPIQTDKANATNATYATEYFRATPFDRDNRLNPPLERISDREYWHIESSNFGGSTDDDAKISLSYRASSLVGATVAERNDLVNAQYTSTPRWEPTGGGYPAVVTGTAAFGYVKHNAFAGNFTFAERRFTLASRSIFNILPYNILNWNAYTQNNTTVDLDWDISFDQDVATYVIDHSTNGTQFQQLLSLSSQQKSYSQYKQFHFSPTPGWNYYKLKIVDRLGNIVSAGIKKVWINDGKGILSIYPNPTQQVLHVNTPNYTGKTLLQIIDAAGKLVTTIQPVSNSIDINVQKLASGAYMIKVIQGKKVQIMKFNKL
jgi:hypothetical protein